MAKRTFEPVTSIDEAIAAFIEGARLHHAGMYIESDQLNIKGLKRTNQGVNFIDAHCPTRDVLLPLLQHEEDIVQITAASALIPSHMALALTTIRRVHATSVTEAFNSSVAILTTSNTFGDYYCGLCKPDPRYPPAGQRPEGMIIKSK